jgi:LysR family hydrogen peroxide-inducible transcriptional activator
MLTSAFPQLKLQLIEERTNDLTAKLLAGNIDAAILALPIAQEQLKIMPLYNEAFLLAASKSHPFAKRKHVRQQDLANQTLLLLAEGHCLREQALSFCQKISTPDVAAFQATSLETLRHMVANGNGITLMPSLAQQTKDHLAYIPFQTPKPSRTMALCWRNSSVKNTLLTDISLLIQQKMGAIETT